MVIVFVIVIVFVFFLSHTEYAEYAELPVLESLVHAALESADFAAGFATTAMRGVPLTAHPLHAHRLSFLISHFSVPTAPAVVT